MDDQHALSSLCALCYSEKPKYRCPRCKVQTCSLVCYKQHQRRAACNGLRDPTVYKKKRQIATPAGIDHDYNYLKGVERQIEIAADNVRHAGVSKVDDVDAVASQVSSSRTASRARLAGGSLQRYLHDSKITVEYAPIGMSRQRSNLTRSSNRGKIMWTVEWVEAGGKTFIQHDCSASSSVAAAYERHRNERRNAEKRKADTQASRVGPMQRPRTEISDSTSKRKFAGDGQGNNPQGPCEAPSIATKAADGGDGEFRNTIDEHHQDADKIQPDGGAPNVEAHSGHESVEDMKLTKNAQRQMEFYLLQPHGPNRVWNGLVPLSDSDSRSLTDVLRGRSVREYPTIYALQPSDGHPAGYTVLDPLYMPAKAGLGPVTRERNIGTRERFGQTQNETPSNTVAPEADANTILDMLRRDLRA